jgi:hypothetical protein
MLNSFIAKRVLFSRGMMMNYHNTRYFATLNTSHLDKALSAALSEHGHHNWSEFFGGIKPSDITGSDAQSVG